MIAHLKASKYSHPNIWNNSHVSKQPRKVVEIPDDTVFPIITLWEVSVAMETRVLIRSAPKLNVALPDPNDASDKI